MSLTLQSALPPAIPLGDAGKVARVTPMIDGEPRMPIQDVICCVCNTDTKYANQILTRLKVGNHYAELSVYCRTFKFPGKGQREMPCTSLEGAIKLLMLLPGETVKCCRTKIAETMIRHLKGDPTLAIDTAHNASIGLTAACEAFLSDAFVLATRKREAEPELGYVYGTASEAFPGLIKIGRTGNLDARLCSLNTSCAPLPHRLVAVAPTRNPVRDERVTHAYFADQREEGEFFRVTVEELQAFFDVWARCNV